ncbi:MXAN_6230/SCO0854 family RING domain-containing protein [Massilia scottii]|uniref:MXAN_6230/SCO0854 family RING domain-containing protein n=1 Tax=Massilia scottii TaxID=3057166 RepID=UPI002796B453|nr:MXAN_6230/SCO0854 family RING domain-containing protein [Massilia sp. CCM 9029]MDQ1832458.1 MXAN_6230/SCO0854 family RING domain-containing protein [Massilia sp. CCM 9029]
MSVDFQETRALLLRRQASVFAPEGAERQPEACMQLFDIDLAKLGYALSQRLRARLQTVATPVLTALQEHIWKTLAAQLGGNRQHTPLFRRFPDNIPSNTHALWVDRVLTHFMQAPGQPCVHCGRTGTTHVLKPCQHVVCGACFDGANYSACPICHRHADRDSPFFLPAPALKHGTATGPLKLLDLGESMDDAAQVLVRAMCERKQAMSPVDTDDFKTLAGEYRLRLLAWIPGQIPVRENIALLFGTLLKHCEPATVLAAAGPHIGTATDVIRLVAVYSGADPSLQGQVVYRQVPIAKARGMARFKALFTPGSYWNKQASLPLPVTIKRFKMARLGRPLRRALLALLESLHPDSLTEDMLRHRSYWVWLGEFLHPQEYHKRYPKVAFAFSVVRKKGPDGTPGPQFETFYAGLEKAVMRKDAIAMVALLRQRPGELARRFDHALSLADGDSAAVSAVLDAFARCAPQFATPVLLTLGALLPTRLQAGETRIYWPKGSVATGFMAPDQRAPLPQETVKQAVALIERELLARFSGKPPVGDWLIDAALADIMVPFNERTASRSAIQLPRGSVLPVPPGKKARLFLHWCQPENGARSDLDLSVAFYDEQWCLRGVCSYYQLTCKGSDGSIIATSAGDLTDAPFPDGASEFVDLDCELARRNGVRYAVAVLNNYSGMPFEDLEHAFAGLMFRDDVQGAHFDPRTVALRFDLAGTNGVFLPMVFDLRENQLHWLDLYAPGGFEFNNVATSTAAISAVCPAMIAYFASSIRMSMYHLALLHGAARAQRVILRGDGTLRALSRHEGENNASFLARLRRWNPQDVDNAPVMHEAPLFAALLDADIALPENSIVYALRPGVSAATIAASDLIS